MDLEEFEENFEAELETAAPVVNYNSPLMSYATGNRLTVDMLIEEIPKIRAGEEAEKRLNTNVKMTIKVKKELMVVIKQGKQSKEKIFVSALPLIRTVAVKEFKRRQQWNSRVSLDDLMQEAIVGFFKGLSGFKVESIKTSATNYLGQWMLVEMRRSAEVMDHDLQVGHDAGERFRRIRAIRSRLVNDLGREPTDQEISDASRDPKYVVRPGMVGKAPNEGEKPAIGKGISLTQIEEEKKAKNRVGFMSRISTGTEENEDSATSGVFVDEQKINTFDIVEDSYSDPAEIAANVQSNEFVSALVYKALEEMKLPVMQTEVISRRYGLSPHTEQASARKIAKEMGIHRERIARILAAFTSEMTKTGGVFHRIISRINREDLDALDLSWLYESLGAWDESYAEIDSLPSILTENFTKQNSKSLEAELETKASGFLAWYLCDFEDKVFTGMYLNENDIPKYRVCSDCNKNAELFKTTKTG